MEYMGTVGAMVMEQVVLVNDQVPDNHTFSGMVLRDFISDHEERLAEVEGFLGIMDLHLCDLQSRDCIQQDEIRDLRGLVDQLLERVTALEGRRDTPIEILDIPIPFHPCLATCKTLAGSDQRVEPGLGRGQRTLGHSGGSGLSS